MDSWDLTTLDVEVHKPSVLRSDRGAARAIAINLPAGDALQEHEVHEHAYLVCVAGELEIEHDGGTESAGVGYVASRKGVRAGRRTTWVRLTSAGRTALDGHVAALRALIDGV